MLWPLQCHCPLGVLGLHSLPLQGVKKEARPPVSPTAHGLADGGPQGASPGRGTLTKRVYVTRGRARAK